MMENLQHPSTHSISFAISNAELQFLKKDLASPSFNFHAVVATPSGKFQLKTYTNPKQLEKDAHEGKAVLFNKKTGQIVLPPSLAPAVKKALAEKGASILTEDGKEIAITNVIALTPEQYAKCGQIFKHQIQQLQQDLNRLNQWKASELSTLTNRVNRANSSHQLVKAGEFHRTNSNKSRADLGKLLVIMQAIIESIFAQNQDAHKEQQRANAKKRDVDASEEARELRKVSQGRGTTAGVDTKFMPDESQVQGHNREEQNRKNVDSSI